MTDPDDPSLYTQESAATDLMCSQLRGGVPSFDLPPDDRFKIYIIPGKTEKLVGFARTSLLCWYGLTHSYSASIQTAGLNPFVTFLEKAVGNWLLLATILQEHGVVPRAMVIRNAAHRSKGLSLEIKEWITSGYFPVS